MASFSARIGSWNGACYECVEREEFDDLEAAKAWCDETPDGDWGDDYDLQATIEDEDGDEIYCVSFQRSANQSSQEECEVIAEDEGEFTTFYLGAKQPSFGDTEFYRWSRNGGHRGAHDRMHGSGRWIETYDEPEEISAGDAVIALVQDFGFSVRSAAKAIADAGWDDRDVIVDTLIDSIAGIDNKVDAARAMPGVRF